MDTEKMKRIQGYIELWFRNAGELYEQRESIAKDAILDRLEYIDVTDLLAKAENQRLKDKLFTIDGEVISEKLFERIILICLLNDTGYLRED